MLILHRENDEIKVYGPSIDALKSVLRRRVIAFISLIIFMVRDDEPARLNFLIYFAIFMVAVIFLSLWSFREKLPHIKLSPKGIEFSNVFIEQFHSWEYTGPFRSHKIENSYTRIGYLCAHSRETEQMLRRGDNYILADHENAEIKIPLQGLSAGLSDAEAEKLCQEVNDWREKYGPQKSTLERALPSTVSQIKADLKKKKIKAKLQTYSIVAIIFAIIYISYEVLT